MRVLPILIVTGIILAAGSLAVPLDSKKEATFSALTGNDDNPQAVKQERGERNITGVVVIGAHTGTENLEIDHFHAMNINDGITTDEPASTHGKANRERHIVVFGHDLVVLNHTESPLARALREVGVPNNDSNVGPTLPRLAHRYHQHGKHINPRITQPTYNDDNYAGATIEPATDDRAKRDATTSTATITTTPNTQYYMDVL